MYVLLLSSPIGVDLQPYVNHLMAQKRKSDYVVLPLPGCFALSDLMVQNKIRDCFQNRENQTKFVIIYGALAFDDAELLKKCNMTIFVHVEPCESLSLHIKAPCSLVEKAVSPITPRRASAKSVSVPIDDEKIEEAIRVDRAKNWERDYKTSNDAIYASMERNAPVLILKHTAPLSEASKSLLTAIPQTVAANNGRYKLTMFPLPAAGYAPDGGIFELEM